MLLEARLVELADRSRICASRCALEFEERCQSLLLPLYCCQELPSRFMTAPFGVANTLFVPALGLSPLAG